MHIISTCNNDISFKFKEKKERERENEKEAGEENRKILRSNIVS